MTRGPASSFRDPSGRLALLAGRAIHSWNSNVVKTGAALKRPSAAASTRPPGLLREIADLFRYLRKTQRRDKVIVFYSEHESYYAYLEGLVEKLIEMNAGPVCYVTSDPDDRILSCKDPKIRAFYLKKLLPLFMGCVGCKVFVMTLTDLNQFHLKRSINNVHYVYVFHALNSSHMAYRAGAFDHYDSILCVGPHIVKEVRRNEELHDLNPKQLIEAGYYRLERIHEAYRQYQATHTETSEKKLVLVAPSWGAGNILEAHGVTLVRALLDSGYDVIFRFHPEVMKRFPDLLVPLEQEFGANPRMTLEKSVSTDDSLLRADVLITDWSGIALEYAFGTERPVLYLDVPRKVHNDQYTTLEIEPFEVAMRSQVGIVFPATEIANIHKPVEQLIRDRSVYQARIADLRSKYVYAFGRSSEIGARHILAMAGKNPDAS